MILVDLFGPIQISYVNVLGIYVNNKTAPKKQKGQEIIQQFNSMQKGRIEEKKWGGKKTEIERQREKSVREREGQREGMNEIDIVGGDNGA